MTQAPTLLVRVGPAVRELDPASGEATIGRDPAATVQLADDRISRRHVRLQPAQGHWLAVDTSSNGTYYQGRKQPQVKVEHDLTLHLGAADGIAVDLELDSSAAPEEGAPHGSSGAGDNGAEAQVLAAEPSHDNEPSGEVDAAIARVGAAVAVRRQELDLTQRSLARDGVVAAGALIALEKGRRWPRNKTIAKIEQALGWQPGTMNQLRSEATEALSNTVGAPQMAGVIQLALDTIGTRIDELPPPTSPDYTIRIATVLQELRQLEDLTGGAARSARGSAALALSLGKIRKTYDDLMRAAAQAPTATLGQRLYAARQRVGLTAEEAANAAGVSVAAIAAAEADQSLDPMTATAVRALVDQLA